MKYLIPFLLLSACATAATTPSPAPSGQPEAQPIEVMGEPSKLLRVLPNGDIVVRGKVVANDPEAFTALAGGIANLQSQIKACAQDLQALKKKPETKGTK